ncbi:hypothetical protein ACSAGD_01085 [Paramicrobacterium sp. CJ85]|uniref:hypothetical protein n=1 Tax=Paramicrobacterium sp. CJ85 TaxID=3445355 RepID=UPI003F647109
MPASVDLRPLQVDPHRGQLAAFMADVKAGVFGKDSTKLRGLEKEWSTFIGGFILFGVIGLFIVVPKMFEPDADPMFTAVSAIVIFAALLCGAAIGGWFYVRPNLNRWKERFALAEFAFANGWRFEPATSRLRYPGLIFPNFAGNAEDRTTASGDRSFDIGNYTFIERTTKVFLRHQWHYIAIRLERNLPHMVLDSRGNNPVVGSNLPMTVARDQVLSLEGDFDRYFTLYCPREYERDALYVFTPDLMALLIDNVAVYDAEIVDDWLFFYSTTPFEPRDEAQWRRMLSIVDVVGAKALSRTERYTDSRTAATGPSRTSPRAVNA